MRYLTYMKGNRQRLGSLQDGYIVDVGHVAGFESLLDLLNAGPDSWRQVAELLKAANVAELEKADAALKYHAGLVLPPIAKPPKNVICLGRNYYKHFLEGAVARGSDQQEKPPEAPIYFTKPHTSITGPFDVIPDDPEVSTKLDWEAEMGVIIGVGGRKISRENAMQHVFGYTVINDLSARDLQFRHQQWFRGKGIDYGCPMGPFVVTPDELPDPVHVPIKLTVNGVTKQDANTGQLMFDIPAIIADLSQGTTLEPGDVISTGTPEGVGHFAQPPEYLHAGDIMETIIEGVGTMRNRIVTPAQLEIIETYNRARNELLNLIADIEPHQYGLPTACEGWSVKDLVAHVTNSAASVQMLMQRTINREPNPGVAALNERNEKGVTGRRERSSESMVAELCAAHHDNIEFYLTLSDEQLNIEGTMVSGEVVTVGERFRRAARHYAEHGDQIRAALRG
jgi:uncharacterized protein (TIGR03083 family)